MLKDPLEQKPMKLSGNIVNTSVSDSEQDVEITLVNRHNDGVSYVVDRGLTPFATPLDSYGYSNFTKHEHLVMKWCDDLAELSYCERAKMGAIIMIDEKTFITGYNGTLEGFENKCDDISLVCNICNIAVDPDDYVEGEKHCKTGYIEKRPKSNLNVVHAETNAILHAGVNGMSVVGKTMFMTTSPCITCANNIVKAKLGKIIYKNEHDDLRGLETLRKANVTVVRYNKEHSC